VNIIFIAPPSAGKGTQSSLLEKQHGYVHISTGDLLRAEIKRKSEIGKSLEEIISRGELVSDEIITELLKNQLKKISNNKFILDGYPRTKEQAIELSKIFNELGINNYKVLYLDLDEDTALKRALGRVICSNCGATYNQYIEDLMPKEKGICDKCHEQLVSRPDDTEKAMKQRFESYVKFTKPVLKYYETEGVLSIIDASKNAKEVYEEITNIISCE